MGSSREADKCPNKGIKQNRSPHRTFLGIFVAVFSSGLPGRPNFCALFFFSLEDSWAKELLIPATPLLQHFLLLVLQQREKNTQRWCLSNAFTAACTNSEGEKKSLLLLIRARK